MITLRHHVISLAAVFLALAIGVVLGSGAFSGTAVSGLRGDNGDLQKQISTLTDEKTALNERLSAASEFDSQIAGRIVRGALNGKSVVLFSTVAADTGMSFHASIATAKAAVEGLTRALAGSGCWTL